jgi:hypothetical protein
MVGPVLQYLTTQLFTVDVPGDLEDEAGRADISEDELEPTFEYQAEESDDDERPQTTSSSALWQDPADKMASVSLAGTKRLRKLARGKANVDNVNGEELQHKLREQ